MENMMRNFIKNMGKEDKQKMMQELARATDCLNAGEGTEESEK